LYVVADPHLGSKHSDEQTLHRIVGEIAGDPCARWVGLGDYADYINLKDPRFDPRELAPWLMGADALADIGRAESEHFIEIMRPAKECCLALISGNHEDAILKHSDHDVYARVIDGLRNGHELRLNHAGFLTWKFTRQGGSVWALRMYLSHGSGGGQSGGNVGNKLKALADSVDGVQVVMMGHHHDPEYRVFSRLRVNGNGVRTVDVHAISAPALTGHMAYAESKDYRPRPTDYCVLTIEPDKRSIRVSMEN